MKTNIDITKIKDQLIKAYNKDVSLRQVRDGDTRKGWKKNEVESFTKLLEKDNKRTILELGSGIGTDALYFESKGFEVLATDISIGMVEKCQSRGLEARVLDTARRELMEETGLEFEKYIVKGILRDHVFLSDSGKLVEDKIFFVILATQPKGTIQDTECGKNYWIKKEDFKDLDPQYYNEVFNLEIGLGDGEIELNEKTFIVDQF